MPKNEICKHKYSCVARRRRELRKYGVGSPYLFEPCPCANCKLGRERQNSLPKPGPDEEVIPEETLPPGIDRERPWFSMEAMVEPVNSAQRSFVRKKTSAAILKGLLSHDYEKVALRLCLEDAEAFDLLMKRAADEAVLEPIEELLDAAIIRMEKDRDIGRQTGLAEALRIAWRNEGFPCGS